MDQNPYALIRKLDAWIPDGGESFDIDLLRECRAEIVRLTNLLVEARLELGHTLKDEVV